MKSGIPHHSGLIRTLASLGLSEWREPSFQIRKALFTWDAWEAGLSVAVSPGY